MSLVCSQNSHFPGNFQKNLSFGIKKWSFWPEFFLSPPSIKIHLSMYSNFKKNIQLKKTYLFTSFSYISPKTTPILMKTPSKESPKITLHYYKIQNIWNLNLTKKIAKNILLFHFTSRKKSFLQKITPCHTSSISIYT